MKKNMTYRIEEGNITIKDFLLSNNISSKAISTLKKQVDGILVNGKVQFTNYKLQPNDILSINLDENNDYENIIATKMDLDILYEDDDIVIVNKSADITVHPSKKYFTNSLVNGLTYYYQNKNMDVKLHCITRLDKETSGCVLFAKNRIAANCLSNMVKQKEISKTYLSLASGKVSKQHFLISAPISRISKGNILRCVDFQTGKEALTECFLLEYYPSNDISLLKCLLHTGRTHQIRVHLQYINHPIVSDSLYNKSCNLLLRQGLHCYNIRFIHPISHQLIDVTSQLPADLKQVLI
ncbi:MAG: RluA family pseudouridine synthase [Erysipelotrichaceae bacterium]|nr:RluA family pseudouridine synthase [Erysipelotrichaceae bacterium]